MTADQDVIPAKAGIQLGINPRLDCDFVGVTFLWRHGFVCSFSLLVQSRLRSPKNS